MTRIVLPYPPSANEYWRSTIVAGHPSVYPSTKAKAYKRTIGYLAMAQGLRKLPHGFLVADMVLHPKQVQDAASRARKYGVAWHLGLRCLDPSNAPKIVLDALEGIAYDNDEQVLDCKVQRGLPTPNGGLVLELTPWPSDRPFLSFPDDVLAKFQLEEAFP